MMSDDRLLLSNNLSLYACFCRFPFTGSIFIHLTVGTISPLCYLSSGEEMNFEVSIKFSITKMST